ncbi:MAG: MATE family efflux transporter [Paludibacterium sp.]|uniref:MATE family efflux transporter n=1 Tax=Paludibacterium sp. TaxID=1917523 RepID=UPI0025D53ED8|nr:MATE family efflux transporter [Paludibacterium sp.]MBV8049500.1 MATE family efflux transporter [Paludibacterium sp.]MBV8646239.1 MATE family efflux transporter [Paludibacterium sp.]
MHFDLNRTPSARLFADARQIIHLALPMMVAQTAQVATGFVDAAMSGHVSTEDLAAVSIGSSIFLTTYVTLMGLVTALNPILSHLLGAGEHERIGAVGRQGLWFGLIIGLIGTALLFAVQPLLRSVLHLPAAVEDKTMLFITGTALAMPAAMVHRALHAFAASLNRPRPIMVMSIAALLLNIPLNYILIHGLFGMPRLGGAGCGWATAAAFWFNAAALFCYIAANRHFRPYGLTRRVDRPDWRALREFLHLGLPIGLSFFVEISLFAFIALLIAPLGALTVASHQAAMNFSSIIYMVPQSISSALTVLVGQRLGADDARGARRITGVGIALGLMGGVLIMLAIFLWRSDIIRLYTDDPRLIELGASLLLFAAVYQLTDSTQTIASGALRGYKLTRVPMLIHVTAFWGVGLALGVLLGRTDWLVAPPMGVYGFWTALVISLSAAALLLISYLARQSRLRLTAPSSALESPRELDVHR